MLVNEYYGAGYAAFYCMMSVIMTFGLFNVIVAIYVENTVAASKFNDLRQKQERLMDQQMFAEHILSLVKVIWQHYRGEDFPPEELGPQAVNALKSMQISPEFFTSLCERADFRDILRSLDIPDEEHLYLFDTLDIDGSGTLDLDELVQGVHKLRGDARRSDIIAVSLMVRAVQQDMRSFQSAVQQQINSSADRLINVVARRGQSRRSPDVVVPTPSSVAPAVPSDAEPTSSAAATPASSG